MNVQLKLVEITDEDKVKSAMEAKFPGVVLKVNKWQNGNVKMNIIGHARNLVVVCRAQEKWRTNMLVGNVLFDGNARLSAR